MKKIIFISLLGINSLTLTLLATPLMMHNQYREVIYFKTNLNQGQIQPGDKINIGEFSRITSIDIKKMGPYSSLKNCLATLNEGLRDIQNASRHPLIIILPEQSSMSPSWKVRCDWVPYTQDDYEEIPAVDNFEDLLN